jgi:hypothetical protein
METILVTKRILPEIMKDYFLSPEMRVLSLIRVFNCVYDIRYKSFGYKNILIVNIETMFTVVMNLADIEFGKVIR